MPLYCFFHIEKCMGTSLRIALTEYFCNIYSNTDTYNPEINNESNLITNKDYNYIKDKNYKVLLCHCNYNEKNITEFSKTCFSITCIRETFSRILSHYYFFDKNKYNCNFYELNDNDIIEIIDDYGNLLVKRLSGNTYNLDNILDNLNYINCILILENINEDILLLNKSLNNYTKTNNTINITKTNSNQENINYTKDYERLYEFKHLLENDILIYNYIKNMDISERFKNL